MCVGRAVQTNSTHNVPNDFLNCIERTLRSAQLFLPIRIVCKVVEVAWVTVGILSLALRMF